jgi:seryl-tRNA synthetase
MTVSNSVYLFKTDNQALSTKLGALEREYQKVQKSIDRSKKAKDIDVLLNENENLQVKLETQEDDFRLQNQTLLWELSAVSEIVAVRLVMLYLELFWRI